MWGNFGLFCSFSWNSLASMVNYIVIQMRKTNREEGYLNNDTLYILTLVLMFPNKGCFTWIWALGCISIVIQIYATMGLCTNRTILTSQVNHHMIWIDHFTVVCSVTWPWLAARLEVTLFWYRPHCFCCVNQIVLMLTRCIYMTQAERSVSKQGQL